MSVLDCLPGSDPAIHADIEADNARIRLQEIRPKIPQGSITVTELGVTQFKVVRKVPFRHHQEVALGYRVCVQKRHHCPKIPHVLCITADDATEGAGSGRGIEALTAHGE
ncbi:hypothetical protein OG478_35295 [Streptomyces phaeochromogenes]|nr:hypothetical protein OG478_35295 [Streptomyces phaeochromogenes]